MNDSRDITIAESCYDLMLVNNIHWSWSLFSLPALLGAGYLGVSRTHQHPVSVQHDKNS